MTHVFFKLNDMTQPIVKSKNQYQDVRNEPHFCENEVLGYEESAASRKMNILKKDLYDKVFDSL